jgi:quercetin dioxygenase-like cupin family protein
MSTKNDVNNKVPYFYQHDIDEQILEVPPDSILSRTVFSDEQAKVILFGFAPGQELSEHTAARPAVLHFTRGEADLVLGEDHMEAVSGTWVHMPPNLPHSVHAKTPVTMLLYLL